VFAQEIRIQKVGEGRESGKITVHQLTLEGISEYIYMLTLLLMHFKKYYIKCLSPLKINA